MAPIAESPSMPGFRNSQGSAFEEYEKAAAEALAESRGVSPDYSDKQNDETDGSKLYEVDLSKPLVFQVGHLGDRYDDWVHKPIVSKIGPRLFKSDVMEFFTNTKWWMIPLIWLPVVCYAERKALQSGIAASAIPGYMVSGLIFWSLLEYTLHRFLFHSATTSYWGNTFHYLLHGCHHKHPQDPNRLVFPPLLCAIMSAAIVTPFTYILPMPIVYAVYGGSLLGYICYDITHFWLHFGIPTKLPFFYKMRRYHLGHHFKFPESGYGITSPAWDHVWGTYPLSWAKAVSG